MQTVRKWFPTFSRSSISNNHHYSKVTTIKLFSVSDPTKGSHGLPPKNYMGNQNPSWHTFIYNGTHPKTASYNPGRLICLYIKVNLPW